MKTYLHSIVVLIALVASCSSGEATLNDSAKITAEVSTADAVGGIDIRQTDGSRLEDDILVFEDVDGSAQDFVPDTSSCNEIPFGFGCGCSDNTDCQSGFCVPSSQGFVCTEECLEDCPEGWECKGSTGFGVDLIFICLPESNSTCLPCDSDGQCGTGFE